MHDNHRPMRTIPRLAAVLPLAAILALAAGCEAIFGPQPEDTWNRVHVDERLTHAYTGFGFDLFRELRAADPDGNVFASPTSAAFALAMTYNGAVGQTADEMAAALGIQDMTRDEVNAANRVWIDALRDTQDPRAELAIANSIWHLPSLPLLEDFAARTGTYYDAEIRALDFARADAADVINDWVAEHTSGRIDEIVEPPIPANVVAYLINALYFKADWTYRFDPADTRDHDFTRSDGSEVPVDMMWQRGVELPIRFGNADAPFDLLRLPYGNGRFSMVLGLPREGGSLADVTEALAPERWATWMGEMVEMEMSVGLPRLEIEWDASLKPSLEAMGMEEPFVPTAADFSDMFGGDGIYISDVLQKTYLRVDEEGTEAAAVTSVEMRVVSTPPSLVFDRPFFLAIYDHATETVLFLGQVTDPTA